MNTPLLNNVSDLLKPTTEAVRALGRLNVATAEKVANLQLDSLRTGFDLMVANMKAGTEVTDLEGAKVYATRQNEFARAAYERLVADSQVLAGIAKDYSVEAGKLVKDVVPTAPAPVATPKARKAAS